MVGMPKRLLRIIFILCLLSQKVVFVSNIKSFKLWIPVLLFNILYSINQLITQLFGALTCDTNERLNIRFVIQKGFFF